MEKVKKIILFVASLLIVSTIASYLTAFIFKIDIFEHALVECLCFDYMIAYVLIPLLYRSRIRKYISNKYLLFALIFCVFWFLEIFRITFI